jgi:hypothetical protein
MNRNFWIFLAVCAAGAFALVLLASWQSAPRSVASPADPMLLRVHAVPPARLDDIRIALANSLSMGEGQVPLGRVSTTGHPGQLLVLAPAAVQDDIAAAIPLLGEGAAPAAVPASVALDLWSIDAVPGTGADDPGLAPLAAALDAARTTLGAVRFERRDAVSIVARGDGSAFSAEASPRPQDAARGMPGFRVRGQLQGVDGGVTARLSLGSPDVDTTVDLRFGEVLVLAQAAAEDGRTRVLVARARPADARG